MGDVVSWSSASYPVSQRFEAWSRQLDTTHLRWQLDPPTSAGFRARIQASALDGARVLRCACEPVAGSRGKRESSTDVPHFGVVIVQRGREQISGGAGSVVLGPGDLAFWDSERPVRFRVLEPLEKVSLLIPKERLRSILPRVESRLGKTFRGTAALRLASVQMAHLCRVAGEIADAVAPRVLDATLELVGAATAGDAPSPERSARARAFIEQHLDDPDLAPAFVARRLSVSLRTLQSWFQADGIAISAYITNRRLERCRQRLLEEPGTSVTTIAFDAGFGDPGRFARAFRRRYGLSPSAARAKSGER